MCCRRGVGNSPDGDVDAAARPQTLGESLLEVPATNPSIALRVDGPGDKARVHAKA